MTACGAMATQMTSLRTSQFGWEPHVAPVASNRIVMLTGYADPGGVGSKVPLDIDR